MEVFPDAVVPRPPHSLLTFPSAETHMGTEPQCVGQRAPAPSYKIYAESFLGEEHLEKILTEAQTIVDAALQ